MSFLCWSWIQFSIWGLMRAEKRKRISSFNLLAMLWCSAGYGLGFLGYQHTLPAPVEFFIQQHCQLLLLRAIISPFTAQPVFLIRIAPDQKQDHTLGLVELREVQRGPPVKSVYVVLDGILSVNREDVWDYCRHHIGLLTTDSDTWGVKCPRLPQEL